MSEAFNVAGIILASIAVPGQLFSAAVQTFTTISDVQNSDFHIRSSYILFKIQEMRYLVWGQNFDILESGLKLELLPPPVYETVVKTLIHINDVLQRAVEIGDNYGLHPMPPVQPAIEQNRRAALAEIDRQGTMINKVHKSCSLFRRVIWSVRDRKKFVDLIDDIKKHIDALYEFCPVQTKQQLTYAIEASQLARTILNEGREGVQIMQRAARYERDPFLQGVAQLSVEQDFALELQSLERVVTAQNPSFSPLMMDIHHIEIFDETNPPSSRSFGALRNQNNTRIIIEWRTYNPLAMHMSKPSLQARVEALARLLSPRRRPDGFRILDCKGYFEDNTDARFGLVFSYPPSFGNAQADEPTSLYRLLCQTRRVPYLGERFALAGYLAESLGRFLGAGWLHKGINSENLLFFRNIRNETSGSTEGPISLEDPYFTGFALARPDGTDITSSLRAPVTTTLMLYRHPDVAGLNGHVVARYHVMHDIYSLGMVLLEIGTWVKLKDRYSPGSTAQTFRNEIISTAVPQLGPSMGENYMRVVEKCLTGRFDQLARYNGDERDYNLTLQGAFSHEVVEVLKNCHV